MSPVDDIRYNPAKGPIPALDGVRGLAILLVIIVHAFYRGPDLDLPPWLAEFFMFGWTGVELFFVLSGFLITCILLEASDQPGAYRTFIIHRFARLFPLYYGILLVLLVFSSFHLHPALQESLANYRQNWPIYGLYLMNLADIFGWDIADANKLLGPSWSLAIEQHFYLLWPPVVLLLKPHQALRVLAGVYVLAILLRALAVRSGTDPGVIYHFTLFHMDGIAIGSLVALSLHRLRRAPQLFLPAFFILGALLLAVIEAAGTVHYSSAIIQVVGYPVLALFYASMILVTLHVPALAQVFSGRVLRGLGQYSYFIYLVHWPLFLFFDQFPLPAGLGAWLFYVVLCTALLMAMGWVSWHIFERPASRAIRQAGLYFLARE